jgi:hypothetical protein
MDARAVTPEHEIKISALELQLHRDVDDTMSELGESSADSADEPCDFRVRWRVKYIVSVAGFKYDINGDENQFTEDLIAEEAAKNDGDVMHNLRSRDRKRIGKWIEDVQRTAARSAQAERDAEMAGDSSSTVPAGLACSRPGDDDGDSQLHSEASSTVALPSSPVFVRGMAQGQITPTNREGVRGGIRSPQDGEIAAPTSPMNHSHRVEKGGPHSPANKYCIAQEPRRQVPRTSSTLNTDAVNVETTSPSNAALPAEAPQSMPVTTDSSEDGSQALPSVPNKIQARHQVLQSGDNSRSGSGTHEQRMISTVFAGRPAHKHDVIVPPVVALMPTSGSQDSVLIEQPQASIPGTPHSPEMHPQEEAAFTESAEMGLSRGNERKARVATER